MFSHQLVIAVITFLTLVCPYLPCGECCDACAAEIVEVEMDEHASVLCCEGCRPEQQPAKKLPNQECPEGGKSLTCFCGGAVVPPSVECPDLERLFFAPLGLGDVSHDQLVTSVEHHIETRDLRQSGHFPPLISGRDLRILAASYLL